MTQTMIANTTQAAAPGPGMPQYIITDHDIKRVKAIQEAWKAYKGELEPPLDVLAGQLDDNVMENRCAPIVASSVYFLFGKELDISVEKGAPAEAQDFLNKTWGQKEVRIPLLQKLATNGAMAGAAFLRIVPGSMKPNRDQQFRLIGVDPATVYLKTAPQDCETVLLYCIQYSSMEIVNGREQQVYYREEMTRIDPDGDALKMLPDDDDTWLIQHWTQECLKNMLPKMDNWVSAGPPIVWPFPFSPMFMCQNIPLPNDAWGEPDITKDLWQMNNSLNFTISNIQKIIKIYGHPMIYASGVGDADIATQPGRVTILPPTPESKMGAVAITSDVPNALAFSHDVRSSMDERSHVPAVATGREEAFPRGQISGVTMELFFMSLIKKTDSKRCTYGKMIIDVSKALLVLADYSGEIDIELAWQSALPNDNLAMAQYGILLLQIGISKTTVQRTLGFDPEEELALSQAEDAAALDAYSRGVGMPPPGMPGMMAPGQQPPPPQSPFMGRQ